MTPPPPQPRRRRELVDLSEAFGTDPAPATTSTRRPPPCLQRLRRRRTLSRPSTTPPRRPPWCPPAAQPVDPEPAPAAAADPPAAQPVDPEPAPAAAADPPAARPTAKPRQAHATPTLQSRRVSVGLQLAASTRQLLDEATRNDPDLAHELAVLSAVASGRDRLLEHFQNPDGATAHQLFPGATRRRRPRGTEHRVPFTVRLTVDHLAAIDDLWRTSGAPSRAAYVDEALRMCLDENQI